MRLDEIRELIAGSHPAEWHVLNGIGSSYLYELGEPVDENVGPVRAEHESRAVLVADIDVGLAWGMDVGHTIDNEPWTDSFMNKRVYQHLVEVLYRGQPVDREIYATVDGAHGRVPLPTARYAPGAALGTLDAKPEAWEVTRWQRDLTTLVEGLVFGGRATTGVDTYIGRCGLTVVD